MAPSPDQTPSRPFGLSLRAWLAVLGGLTALRFLLAAAYPVYETEAYYWLWSRHLAAGYFDHPPMLGWLCWLTDWWGPPHGLAVRTHTVLSHAVATLLMFWLGRNVSGSDRVGVLSAVLYQVIPFQNAIAVQNQPDSPLLVFWVATVACFERALATGRGRWWIVAGVCAGGAFLSKFHGFVFTGFIFLYLLASPSERRWTRTPWPYLAFLTALLVYSPNIVWNARNEWLTYDFQFLRHGEENELNLRYPLLTLVSPLGYLSPWVYGLVLALWWRAWRGGTWRGGRTEGLLWWMTAPLFGFFLAMAFRQQIKFHWPAPAFALACPMMAAALDAWAPRRRAWFVASAAACSALVYGHLLLSPWYRVILPESLLPPVAEIRPGQQVEKDWTNHTYGWPELGGAIRRAVEALDAEAPTVILAQRFDRAAVAAFYARLPERAWVLNPGTFHNLQRGDPDPRGFMAWQTPYLREGSNAVYIFYERESRAWKNERRLLLRLFREVDPIELDAIELERDGRTMRRIYFVRCRGFRADEPVVLPEGGAGS